MDLMLLVLLAAVSLTVVEPTAVHGRLGPLKIGSFNVQVLGVTKIAKNHVTDILTKIINRFDILLIQEIRDASGNAIKSLLAKANKLAAKSNYQYDMVISSRLGRTVSKEQYAFLYRNENAYVITDSPDIRMYGSRNTPAFATSTGTFDHINRKDLVRVMASTTYLDKKDVFEREPFIVHFSVPTAAVSDMVFIAIHTKPLNAVQEIDSLVDVYNEVLKEWKIKNVVIMGDFNAACNYVKDKEWKNIRLAKDKRFWWLIDDCQDTSVQGSRCAYDRFVATGTDLLNAIVKNSAELFDFKTAYNLNEIQAEEVSDHFPIEFYVKLRAWTDVKENVDYKSTSSLTPSVTKRDVYTLRHSTSKKLGYTVRSLYKRTGGIAMVTLTKTTNDIASAITSIKALRSTFPKLITGSQLELVVHHLSKLLITSNKYPYQVLPQYTSRLSLVNGIKIQLSCDVEIQPIVCSLVIGDVI